MICRSCGSQILKPVLSLGRMPLANALLDRPPSRDHPEPSYPLDVVFCADCALVQITETVPPEILFSHYLYFSSTSSTMLRHAEKLADSLVRKLGLGKNSLVMEAASNDGYLLQYFVRAGIPVLGIEPAKNISEEARKNGVETLTEFFGADLAEKLCAEDRQADVFLANNVMAHVADLNGFVKGVALALKDTGTAVIEVPHVGELLKKTAFDTIYHEHLCYFSLTAIRALFGRHGLTVTDVEPQDIHGGSLRVFARKNGAEGDGVRNLLADERRQGLDSVETYRAFSENVGRLREKLRGLLMDLKSKGNRVAAYGAAAKGAVLLNYCGLGRDTVDYVVDANPHKQGRFMPGTHQPVFPPERLAEDPPSYLLILPWNIQDEIMKQEKDFADRGGRFIIPVPEPKIA